MDLALQLIIPLHKPLKKNPPNFSHLHTHRDTLNASVDVGIAYPSLLQHITLTRFTAESQ